MDTSTSREDPEEACEPKVIMQGLGHYLGGHYHELPALLTDLGSLTACSHIIIVCHINIKDHFFLKWNKGNFLHSQVLGRWVVVDSSNINLEGHLLNQSLLELSRILEAQIPAVHIIF